MRFYFLVITATLLCACASQNQVGTEKPATFNAIEAARNRVSLGLTYLKNGNYVQAKTNLDKALEFAPRYGDAHFALAHYYQQVSEFELAKQYYEQAMSLDRNNPDLINSYGAFLCETGDYHQAKQYLLRAATSKSYNRSAETYENLAICSHRQGKADESLNYVRTALQHQPGRARSWYMFVELLVASQQWQEAKLAFRQYEKVVPVNADTLNLAIEIEQGLGNPKVAKGYQEMLEALYPDKVGQPRKVILAPASQASTVGSPAVQAVSLQSQPQRGVSSLYSGKAKYHVLQKGETLYQISRRYGVSVQALVSWNNILDVSNISIGQKILVSQPIN